MTYAQYSIASDSVFFESHIHQHTSSIVYTRVGQPPLILSVDDTNCISLDRFGAADGALTPPTTLNTTVKFGSDQQQTIIGASIYFTKSLSIEQQDMIIKSLQLKYETDRILSFVSLNEVTGTLLTVVCQYNESSVNCSIIQSFKLNKTQVVFMNYQIVDTTVIVYLQSEIIEVELVQNRYSSSLKRIYYERNFKLLQKFKQKWFGISDTNTLFQLSQVEELVFGRKFFDLVEEISYPTSGGLEYYDMQCTDNYIIATYKSFSHGKTGMSIFMVQNNTFFPQKKSRFDLTSPCPRKGLAPHQTRLQLHRSLIPVHVQGMEREAGDVRKELIERALHPSDHGASFLRQGGILPDTRLAQQHLLDGVQ